MYFFQKKNGQESEERETKIRDKRGKLKIVMKKSEKVLL